jgi:hypothetical protein
VAEHKDVSRFVGDCNDDRCNDVAALHDGCRPVPHAHQGMNRCFKHVAFSGQRIQAPLSFVATWILTSPEVMFSFEYLQRVRTVRGNRIYRHNRRSWRALFKKVVRAARLLNRLRKRFRYEGSEGEGEHDLSTVSVDESLSQSELR